MTTGSAEIGSAGGAAITVTPTLGSAGAAARTTAIAVIHFRMIRGYQRARRE